VCGAPALADVSDARNPLCAQHLPVRLHTVSMTRAPGAGGGVDHVATCRCGWQARRPLGKHRALDLLIRAHWAVVSEEASPCAA
jgi:hypothetical protein